VFGGYVVLGWTQAAHADSWACGILRGMPQENIEVVRQAVTAVNERDLERYLSFCTEDVELHVGPMETVGGDYVGHDAIQRFWTDIADTSPDFHLEIESLQATATGGVIAFMRVNATGRASGIAVMNDVPTANVYDFRGGKIRRIRVFLDRAEALEAVGKQRSE
jgi:ketosteroid isomerase-like protein